MSNIIFLSSIAATIIWAFCYVLIAAVPWLHFLLMAAFIGIVISVCMDERKRMPKQRSSY
ncbi:MAG: hypothetical protein V4685_01240 [Bacteroidota bacterium]